MKMVLIKLKRWLTIDIDACWHLQLQILILDVFLLIIHSMIAGMSEGQIDNIKSTIINGSRMNSLPHHSHQLTSNDRVAAVSTDTKVELYMNIRIARDITDYQRLRVEICTDDFVIEKHSDVVVRRSLL